jgi:hypothetical protein
MKLPRLLLAAGAIVAAVALAPTPAAAQQVQVIQIGCDTLSFEPPLVRVRFAVLNLGMIPICSYRLTPVQSGMTPPDSCRIVGCSFPTGWECGLTPDGSGFWNPMPVGPCIERFQKFEPFDIELDPFFCCYRADFMDQSGNVIASQVVCFECDKPVVTRSSTWGDLKVRYR